jgi:hypothetical protein
VQHVGGKLPRITQEREMADLGLNQEPGAGDVGRYELGVRALDRLAIIGIDDPDRGRDRSMGER